MRNDKKRWDFEIMYIWVIVTSEIDFSSVFEVKFAIYIVI